MRSPGCEEQRTGLEMKGPLFGHRNLGVWGGGGVGGGGGGLGGGGGGSIMQNKGVLRVQP